MTDDVIKIKSKKMKSKKKIPLTPMAFYIKLFCERKGSLQTNYSNLIAATKSWVSLSESEKNQFTIKYKECEKQYVLQFFDQLKNAEIFMKEKDISSKNNMDLSETILSTKEIADESIKTVPEPELERAEQTETETIKELTPNDDDSNPHASPTVYSPEHREEMPEDLIPAVDEITQPKRTILMEPLPPTIKTGHELFYMLNSTNEANTFTWTTLPRIEKNRYSRAVSLMKKDYISKYREYLESLSDKELFDCYNKNIL
ncbi:uncharacterized protein LOC142973857 [Anticarsia gemmatalis]|uniref:uncharacterized protein LOC142973857 n=1 Tax=Anticarsia gemmatalis TaxID=129554 RepID=UPI003F76F74C